MGGLCFTFRSPDVDLTDERRGVHELHAQVAGADGAVVVDQRQQLQRLVGPVAGSDGRIVGTIGQGYRAADGGGGAGGGAAASRIRGIDRLERS